MLFLLFSNNRIKRNVTPDSGNGNSGRYRKNRNDGITAQLQEQIDNTDDRQI